MRVGLRLSEASLYSLSPAQQCCRCCVQVSTTEPLLPPYRYDRSRESTCTSHQHGWGLIRQVADSSVRLTVRPLVAPIPMRLGTWCLLLSSARLTRRRITTSANVVKLHV